MVRNGLSRLAPAYPSMPEMHASWANEHVAASLRIGLLVCGAWDYWAFRFKRHGAKSRHGSRTSLSPCCDGCQGRRVKGGVSRYTCEKALARDVTNDSM